MPVGEKFVFATGCGSEKSCASYNTRTSHIHVHGLFEAGLLLLALTIEAKDAEDKVAIQRQISSACSTRVSLARIGTSSTSPRPIWVSPRSSLAVRTSTDAAVDYSNGRNNVSQVETSTAVQ